MLSVFSALWVKGVMSACRNGECAEEIDAIEGVGYFK